MSRKRRGSYPLWTDVPYAGESHPPRNAVTPYAGSWKTYFIERSERGGFETLDGRPIELEIVKPDRIDWYEELKLVQRVADRLTEEDKLKAVYWGSGPPSKQWVPIVDALIDTYGVEPPRAARILGALFSGLNDALVVTWYLKYKWLVPRPNQLDREFATVICTPNFPAYPSGHAAVSGAAEVILSYFFPSERRRLRELAEEDAESRLLGGVHFKVDNDQGLRLGRQIGRLVVEQLEKDLDSEGLPVDVHYREFRNAKLIPPPYEQGIPFDFEQQCGSLLRSDVQQERKRKRDDKGPKPKLFF
ncbi:vanadium-dependent haloperoxidase [Thalassobacillus hwangdonensis]|uniref:Vanadium-dependent haloperoxidase n=1 Tax=Thalassobacillus hwangdonensis TaxID=546108 RepID=A0ABW3L4A7_9BACI